MPTTITSAGITFNDATTLTSAVIPANAVGATQIADGSVTAAKLGTTEQKQIAKAWVNFNGTTSPGTIRSSYNVSSVTKNGTGQYTVNFASSLADSNYSVYGCAINNGTMSLQIEGPFNGSPVTKTVSAIRVSCAAVSVLYDCSDISVSVLGN